MLNNFIKLMPKQKKSRVRGDNRLGQPSKTGQFFFEGGGESDEKGKESHFNVDDGSLFNRSNS